MNRPMQSLFRLAGRGLAALALAVPALAQDEPPPWTYVTELESEKQIFQWVAAALFIVGCVAIAFKNPHRSHLD
jgi:hypothetical protein